MPDDGPEPGGPLVGPNPQFGPAGGSGAEPPRKGPARPGLSRQVVKVNPKILPLPGVVDQPPSPPQLHPKKGRKSNADLAKIKRSKRVTFKNWKKGVRGEAALERRKKAKPIKYVQACKDKAWTLDLERLDGTAKVLVCFKCHSWRHPGPCQAEKLWNDILKTAEGFKGNEKISAYIIATHDTAKGIDRDLHWSYLADCWDRRLRGRMETLWGEYKFTRTLESTRAGWGHVNIGIVCPGIAAWCDVPDCPHVFEKRCPNPNRWCRNCHGTGMRIRLCGGWAVQRKRLQAAAIKSGFGMIVWLAPVKDAGKFANYINKSYESSKHITGTGTGVAMELTGSAVKNQLPTDAPPRTRRVSWSRDWPEPPEADKPKEWTGELWTIPLDKVAAYKSLVDAQGQPSNSCEIFKSADLDSSCIPPRSALVLVCAEDGRGRKSEDGRDVALPCLRPERLADVLCEGAEARPCDGHADPRQQGGQALQVGPEEQVSGPGLSPDVARSPDGPSGPPGTPPRDVG
jgi:hypothetical protein